MEKDKILNIILILSFGILIFIFIKSTNRKLLNNQPYTNVENTLDQKIKESHMICPVMGNQPKISACIHYPPFNRGFIVSVCCETCISEIQKSFKMNDLEYTIHFEDEMYVLYYKNEMKQILLECSKENMEKTMKLANTEMM